MAIEFKEYGYLPKEAIEIRDSVFVKEQGFAEEFDTVDGTATHIVTFCDGKAAATCRFFGQEGYYLIGRIAVLQAFRSQGFGGSIIRYAEERISAVGGKEIRIHAQARVEGIYRKLGYVSIGDYDFDENCRHIWMVKYLN